MNKLRDIFMLWFLIITICSASTEKKYEFCFLSDIFKEKNIVKSYEVYEKDKLQYISLDDITDLLKELKTKVIVRKINDEKVLIKFIKINKKIVFNLINGEISFNGKTIENGKYFYKDSDDENHYPLYLLNMILAFYDTKFLSSLDSVITQLFYDNGVFKIDLIKSSTVYANTEKELSKEEKLFFISYFKNILNYFYEDENELINTMFLKYEAKLKDSKDNYEFYKFLDEVFKEIEDYHLILIKKGRDSDKLKDLNRVMCFNAYINIIGNKWYFKGKEILEINNIKINSLKDIKNKKDLSMEDFQNAGSEIFNKIMSETELNNLKFLNFKLKEDSGNIENLKHDISDLVKKELLRFKYVKNKKLYFDVNEDIGYIYIPSWDSVFYYGENLFKENNIFAKAVKKSRNKKYLIVDIRNNSGGIIDLTLGFIRFISKKDSFLFIKTGNELRKILLPSFNILKNKTKIIVLINNRTYSASNDFAILVKDNEIGTLVGERSGGGAKWLMSLILPDNSQLQLPVHFFRTTDRNEKDYEKGVEPDIYIKEKDNEPYYMKNKVIDMIKNGKFD